MSKQEKQLREFKRLVQEAVANADHKNDLGVNLISNVSADFDDYIAFQKLNEKETKREGILQRLKIIVVWPFKLSKLLNYGPPYTDSVTRNFINELGNKGVITRAQIRLLNVYQMIRLESNGSCFITFPSCNDYFKAKVMLGVLLILTPFSVLVVWEVSSCILPGLPFAYVAGVTVGLLWRGAYDLAWGREKLAKYITSRYPWFRTTQHGLEA